MKKKLILAFGEVTGHKHVLDAEIEDVVMNKDVPSEFTTKTDGKITHEEHQERSLPPDTYERSIVKEWDHAKEESREVID